MKILTFCSAWQNRLHGFFTEANDGSCSLQTGLTTDVYIISGILFFLAGCFYSMAFLNITLIPSEHTPHA